MGGVGPLGRVRGPSLRLGHGRCCSSASTSTPARRSTWSRPSSTRAGSSRHAGSSPRRSDHGQRPRSWATPSCVDWPGAVPAPGTAAPLGVYLFRSADPAAELARHVERVVFMETFGNTPELLAKEYAPYDGRQRLLVRDRPSPSSSPPGPCGSCFPRAAGFKTLDDAAPVWGEPVGAMAARTEIDIDLARTWDIATLAVAPEYRGKATMGLVSMGLYQALAMATTPVRHRLAPRHPRRPRVPHDPVEAAHAHGGLHQGVVARPYLGSPASMPVWCNVGDTERRLARVGPRPARSLLQGRGAWNRRCDRSTWRGTAGPGSSEPRARSGRRGLQDVLALLPERVDHVGEPVGPDRPRVQVSLQRVAPEVHQPMRLGRRLHALRRWW